jgi:hypothetical protein
MDSGYYAAAAGLAAQSQALELVAHISQTCRRLAIADSRRRFVLCWRAKEQSAQIL